MSNILGFLGFLISVYMLIIFIRILMSWFGGMAAGGFQDILVKITDPYINWFRRFSVLRAGNLDLSPIVALGVLSLVNRVISMLARYGTISLGIILALVIQAAWGAVSFILGFLIFILVLRLIAGFFARDGAGPFWNIINTISQPVLFRINRNIFKDRIENYTAALLASIATLVVLYIVTAILVSLISGALARLPF